MICTMVSSLVSCRFGVSEKFLPLFVIPIVSEEPLRVREQRNICQSQKILKINYMFTIQFLLKNKL